MRIGGLVLVVASIAVVGVARPQGPARASAAPGVVVNGVAFDSLHDRPLIGAFVTLASVGRPTASTVSDTSGRFRFDGVRAGVYTVAIQHAVFDSIGISGASARADVSDGRDTLRLSTPSFAGLWHTACGSSTAPRDSGFVFGTIRAAGTRRPVADATVTIRWLAVGLDSTVGVSEHTWRADVRTDSLGDYRVCKVPADVALDVAAESPIGSLSSGSIELFPNGYRVQRLDLLVGESVREAAPAQSGNIEGTVSGDDGQPLAGVRVALDGGPATRTDSTGDFQLHGLPTGTRELNLEALGASAESRAVDLTPRDTVHLSIVLGKVNLPPVRVFAARDRATIKQEFNERRALYAGIFLDSTTIGMSATLAQALENVVSVRSTGNGRIAGLSFPASVGAGQCDANVWIDGVKVDATRLNSLVPSEIAAIESYLRAPGAPPDFIDRTNHLVCGAVVLWTKGAFP